MPVLAVDVRRRAGPGARRWRARCGELGVDARIIAPCDGPPPEPGITTVGPSTRVPSNGSVAPIASGRAVARRTLEAIRTFAARRRAPPRAALAGAEPRRAGGHHASRPSAPSTRRARAATAGTRRSGRRAAADAAAARGVAPRCRRTPGARSTQTFGVKCEIVPNGVDVAEPRRRPSHGRRPRRRSCSWAVTSAARASRCCSTRSRGLDRDAISGSSATARRPGAAARPRASRASSGSGGSSEAEKQARLRGARPSRASRRSTASRSGWSCWRRWRRAPRWWRPTSTATARRPRRASRRVLVPPGDADALRVASAPAARRARPARGARRRGPAPGRRVLDDRSWPSGSSPLYERAMAAPRTVRVGSGRTIAEAPPVE